MSNPIITIYDHSTQQTTVREMTDEEVAECEQATQEMQSTEQVEPDAD